MGDHHEAGAQILVQRIHHRVDARGGAAIEIAGCLLYTSAAADERSSVDLGGRRIIQKKKRKKKRERRERKRAREHGVTSL